MLLDFRPIISLNLKRNKIKCQSILFGINEIKMSKNKERKRSKKYYCFFLTSMKTDFNIQQKGKKLSVRCKVFNLTNLNMVYKQLEMVYAHKIFKMRQRTKFYLIVFGYGLNFLYNEFYRVVFNNIFFKNRFIATFNKYLKYFQFFKINLKLKYFRCELNTFIYFKFFKFFISKINFLKKRFFKRMKYFFLQRKFKIFKLKRERQKRKEIKLRKKSTIKIFVLRLKFLNKWRKKKNKKKNKIQKICELISTEILKVYNRPKIPFFSKKENARLIKKGVAKVWAKYRYKYIEETQREKKEEEKREKKKVKKFSLKKKIFKLKKIKLFSKYKKKLYKRWFVKFLKSFWLNKINLNSKRFKTKNGYGFVSSFYLKDILKKRNIPEINISIFKLLRFYFIYLKLNFFVSWKLLWLYKFYLYYILFKKDK